VRYKVAAIVAGVLVITGVAAVLGIGPTPDPLEHPEKPETLDNQSVEQYVAATEETIVYNDHLSSYPTANNLWCSAMVESETETGYLVFAECKGGIEFINGEHVDLWTESLYFVNDSVTKRSSNEDFDPRERGQNITMSG
jgi:hypothetical protein